MAVGLAKDQAVYVSLNKESTAGTGIDVARKLTMGRGYAPGVVVPVPINNGGMTTGVENATEMALQDKYYQGTLAWDHVHPDDIAWCLAYVLAAPGAPAVVDTSAEQYLFRESTSTVVVPTFSLEETYAASHVNDYAGCMLRSWTLSKSVGTPATMTADWYASVCGSTATVSLPSVISGEPVWMNQPVHVWIGASLDSSWDGDAGTITQGSELFTGTAAVLTGLARSFSIGITQLSGIEQCMSFAGSGIKRYERNIRSFSLSLEIEVEDDTYIDYATTEASNTITPRAVEIEWNSGVDIVSTHHYGARFAFPKVVFGQPSISAMDATTGKRTVTLTGTPLYDTGVYGLGAGNSAGCMMGVVWNNVAANTYAYSA